MSWPSCPTLYLVSHHSAIILHFSTGCVQIDFSRDCTTLILGPWMAALTYINQKLLSLSPRADQPALIACTEVDRMLSWCSAINSLKASS